MTTATLQSRDKRSDVAEGCGKGRRSKTDPRTQSERRVVVAVVVVVVPVAVAVADEDHSGHGQDLMKGLVPRSRGHRKSGLNM
jgi:hypothetical protein